MPTNPVMQRVSYAMRDFFDLLINGDRGYQAPYTQPGQTITGGAAVSLQNGGSQIVGHAPAVISKVVQIPQSADWTQGVAVSRYLPNWSPESTSGGWVATPYSFDPPPEIPAVILPQPQWNSFGGETVLTGLTTQPTPYGVIASFPGTPAPGLAYPAIIGTVDDVTATGAL